MNREMSAYARPLVLVTKIALILWTVITGLGGVALVFVPGFGNAVVWPAPLDPIPQFNAGLYGALAISTGAASLYALRKNEWGFAAPVIAMYLADDVFQEFVAIQRILQGPVPFQVWFYVVFGLVYFVMVFLSYRQQGSM